MSKPRPKFFNNDLDKLIFNFHNKFHFCGSILGGIFLGFGWTYFIGIAWEIKDGCVYWYDDPRWQYLREPQTHLWFKIENYIIRNMFLSDKFSFQDAFVWDLGGAVIGQLLRWAIMYFGIVEMMKGMLA